MNAGSALFLMLLLAGCSMHNPAKVGISVDPPPQFLGKQATGEGALLVGPWWLAFNDQQLNLLMSELFDQNLELTQALARLEQVEALTRITRSTRSPVLSAGASAGRSSQPGLMADFIGDNRQLSLAAGYELDLWGKLAAQSKAAELELSAGRQEVQTLYLGLSARLADLYFLAIEQRAQLTLTDKSVASYTETLSRVENRYNLGLVPAVDLYQARQSLAGAQAARHLFEANLSEVEHAIAVLIGRYPMPRPGRSLVQLPAAPELFEAGLPADLLSRRPDLQAALRRVKAADSRVAVAIAERFPSISLAAGYGSLRQEVTAGLIKGEFWNLLGNLAMPLVDGGRRRAEVDSKQAALREAIADYQQKVLTAFQEVEDALANNFATEQRVERLAETARATAATLRLSLDRYLAGLVDYLPVLTAQRADFEISSRLLAARRQLLADRIGLARALGGDWMRDQLNSRVQVEEDNKQ